MLVNFDPPWICLHDGGSICLVPRIRSTGIVSVRWGIDLLVLPNGFRGDRIPRDTGSTWPGYEAPGNSKVGTIEIYYVILYYICTSMVGTGLPQN